MVYDMVGTDMVNVFDVFIDILVNPNIKPWMHECMNALMVIT
jgi:hypothetical protein